MKTVSFFMMLGGTLWLVYLLWDKIQASPLLWHLLPSQRNDMTADGAVDKPPIQSTIDEVTTTSGVLGLTKTRFGKITNQEEVTSQVGDGAGEEVFADENDPDYDQSDEIPEDQEEENDTERVDGQDSQGDEEAEFLGLTGTSDPDTEVAISTLQQQFSKMGNYPSVMNSYDELASIFDLDEPSQDDDLPFDVGEGGIIHYSQEEVMAQPGNKATPQPAFPADDYLSRIAEVRTNAFQLTRLIKKRERRQSVAQLTQQFVMALNHLDMIGDSNVVRSLEDYMGVEVILTPAEDSESDPFMALWDEMMEQVRGLEATDE
ncbi:MAG: hypothetical protein LH609_08490 [Rudanella sp.]|nr:hypothetical protein [Rudanella sp.]